MVGEGKVREIARGGKNEFRYSRGLSRAFSLRNYSYSFLVGSPTLGTTRRTSYFAASLAFEHPNDPRFSGLECKLFLSARDAPANYPHGNAKEKAISFCFNGALY